MFQFGNTIPLLAVMVLLVTHQVLSEAQPMCSVVQGLPGLNGRDGRDGSNGLKGDPGLQGQTGAKGDRGFTGPPGKLGPSGPIGEKGGKGDIGKNGEKGEKDTEVSLKVSDLEMQVVFLNEKVAKMESDIKRLQIESPNSHPFWRRK